MIFYYKGSGKCRNIYILLLTNIVVEKYNRSASS